MADSQSTGIKHCLVGSGKHRSDAASLARAAASVPEDTSPAGGAQTRDASSATRVALSLARESRRAGGGGGNDEKEGFSEVHYDL